MKRSIDDSTVEKILSEVKEPLVRRQVVELVDASAPVIAAPNRFAELRQQRTTLNEVRMTAHREIAELTAKLRSALRETAAAI